MVPVISHSRKLKRSEYEQIPSFIKEEEIKVKDYLSKTIDYKHKFQNTYLQKLNDSSKKV